MSASEARSQAEKLIEKVEEFVSAVEDAAYTEDEGDLERAKELFGEVEDLLRKVEDALF